MNNLETNELFELVAKYFDKDFEFTHKKALKSYALYDRLEKVFGWDKATTIFRNSKKNFGSEAYYKANPILWSSFKTNPTNESFIHLRNAFMVDVVNDELVRQLLLDYLKSK